MGCPTILFLETPWLISYPQKPCKSNHSDCHPPMSIVFLVTECCQLVFPAPGLPAFLLKYGSCLRGGSPHCSWPMETASTGLAEDTGTSLTTVFLMPSFWVCPLGLLRGCSEEVMCRSHVTNHPHIAPSLCFWIPSSPQFQGSASTSTSLTGDHH